MKSHFCAFLFKIFDFSVLNFQRRGRSWHLSDSQILPFLSLGVSGFLFGLVDFNQHLAKGQGQRSRVRGLVLFALGPQDVNIGIPGLSGPNAPSSKKASGILWPPQQNSQMNASCSSSEQTYLSKCTQFPPLQNRCLRFDREDTILMLQHYKDCYSFFEWLLLIFYIFACK